MTHWTRFLTLAISVGILGLMSAAPRSVPPAVAASANPVQDAASQGAQRGAALNQQEPEEEEEEEQQGGCCGGGGGGM